MRAALAVLLFVFSFDLSAAVIERMDPQSIPADTAEHSITIYGQDLAGPVLFSSKAGEFLVEVEGEGSFIYVTVPAGAHQQPGDVRVTIRDASAILRVTELSPSSLQIQPGDPIVVPAEGRWGARVDYEVYVIGGRDPNPTVKCEPPSGSIFPLGPSNVQCVATNSFGERAEGGPYIFVADYGVPFVKVPDRIRVQAESPQGARVEFTVTAEDDIDGEVPVSCEPKSGSLFPVGETTVSCIAYDSSLNPGVGEFVVEVTAAPKEELLLKLPDPITAEATRPDGAFVEFEVTAYGTSDPNPKVECDPKPGSLFPLGESTVKCVASDSLGNRTEGSFTVTVEDTVAPMIFSLTATPDELKPNQKWEDIKIEVEAADVVDPMPRCVVVDITTNQPGGGMEITGELSVRVLAERDPKLGDRRYDIRVECTDSSKNTSESFATVVVPKGNPDEPTTEPVTGGPKKWKGMRSGG